MQRLARHILLANSSSYEECTAQILGFFEKTTLVQYDKLTLDQEGVIQGDDSQFSEQLEDCLVQNQAVLNKFISELGAAGFHSAQDLPTLQQGYPSKVLHIIAHFLDGFIGIDTVFYNLIDDSHWITEETQKMIQADPSQFWLVPLDGYSMSPREAALLHM